MTLERMSVVLVLLQIAFLVFCIIGAARLLRGGQRVMVVVLFLFGMVSMCASSLYWLVYDVMRPGTRMPFAVNEIAEWAMFLLFGSALDEALRGRFGNARREILCAAVFAAASAGLWIAWSGEWLQDILCGVSFGYLLCAAARGAKLSDAFSRRQWVLLACLAAALILGEAATFLVPGSWKGTVDLICYALMLTGILFFTAKTILALRRGAEPALLLSVSFGSFSWCTSCMYMSDGWFYLAWMAVQLVYLTLMLRAVGREAEA